MRVVQVAAVIFVFWLVLAVPLAPVDLVWGALVSILVGFWAAELLWADGAPALSLRRLAGLVIYTLELIRSIVPAALQVARVILQPTMPIDPVVIKHRMRLNHEFTRVALANSITLTPGTHCVDSENGVLTIHCLDEHFANPVRDGRLEDRITRVLQRETMS
ncbi:MULTISPECIES: Na+/H+ antiporter subunit E [unclassified Wenzhouxiangella]|uniref:Na+/H+ antiporter subunit E n=1 Tax=unclassified Wenzhouxiangella TaxID=2613841 RepID=UPI0015F27712|nr:MULTISPECIES: Na+/H+ antiporter subunit E [unclassified Wenzhouxiangella]